MPITLPSPHSSPSFPSTDPLSSDIFFQVKKEILDKLDIILQKVNLEVIDYMKPEPERRQEKKAFRFIELSQFEKEIQTLFDYLDRLYESLNSSVSFSSNDIKNTLSNGQQQSIESVKRRNLSSGNEYSTLIVNQLGELKVKCQKLQEDNLRLKEENEHMMFLLRTNPSQSHSLGHSFNQESKSSLKKEHNSRSKQARQSNQAKSGAKSSSAHQSATTPFSQSGISLQTVKKILRFYNHSIKQLSFQYKETTKQIKKTLKQVKFQIIENRVECIAQLKKWGEKVESERSGNKGRENIREKENVVVQTQEILVGGKGFQSSRVDETVEDNCGQNCVKRQYHGDESKHGFQEDLLQKIQEILDVC